jgi:hypothetical protein
MAHIFFSEISICTFQTHIIYHLHISYYYYGSLTVTDLPCVGWGDRQTSLLNTVASIMRTLNKEHVEYMIAHPLKSLWIQKKCCQFTPHCTYRVFIPALSKTQYGSSDFNIIKHYKHTVAYPAQIFLEYFL